jgi:hypothetical protein
MLKFCLLLRRIRAVNSQYSRGNSPVVKEDIMTFGGNLLDYKTEAAVSAITQLLTLYMHDESFLLLSGVSDEC